MSSRNFPLSKVVRLKIRYRLNTTFRELPVPPTLLRKLNWYYVLFATLSTFINELYRADSLSRLFHRSFSFDQWTTSVEWIQFEKAEWGNPETIRPANKWSSSSSSSSPSLSTTSFTTIKLLLSSLGIFRSRISASGSGQVYLWRSMKEIICPALSVSLSPLFSM